MLNFKGFQIRQLMVLIENLLTYEFIIVDDVSGREFQGPFS